MGPRTRAAASLLLAALLLAAPDASAERKIELYEVRHRAAEELLPLAETALQPQGRAALDRGTGSILLIGDEASVAEALDVLRTMDRALRTVTLRYESKRLDELESAGVKVDWSVGAGPARIGSVVFPGERNGIRPSGFAARGQGESGLSGILRVREGETGRVGAGRTVPVRSRGFYGTTSFVTAESGFQARPRILGDGRVRVELSPSEAQVDDRGRVRFVEAVTTLVVTPGETVALGGIARTTDAAERGSRAYVARQRSRDERVLLLTVDVQPASGEEIGPAAPLAE